VFTTHSGKGRDEHKLAGTKASTDNATT